MGKKQYLADDIAADLGIIDGGEPKTQSKADLIANDLGLNESPDFSLGNNLSLAPEQSKENKVRDILKSVDSSDAEKEHVVGMALKGAPHSEISDAILTIQGKHPKQEGGYKYYLEDTPLGYKKPIPISNTEKPIGGAEVNSIWGTQDEAEGDSRTTDIAKNIYNVLPKIGGSANDLTQAVYGVVTGEELPWYQRLKNSEQFLKFKTSSEYDKGIIDSSKIHSFSDLLNADSYDFSPSTVANTATQVGQSVLQFMATRGAMGIAGKGTNAALRAGKITEEAAKKAIAAENYAKGFASSYMVNLSEAMDAANQAGITGRDAYLTALAVTVPVAALDMLGGGEGAINKAFREETGKSLVKNLVQGAIKDADGKVTKEMLDDLYKTANASAATIAEKTTKGALRVAAEESAQEVGQNVLQKTSQVIHDNLVSDEDAKYGTEIFSPQSVAEYLNDAFGGLIGGAQGHVLSKALKKKENDEEKSKTIMSAVSGGNENELKTQLAAAHKSGDITPDDYEKGLFRIDTYKKYAEAVADRPLDEESKRKIFDLTYEKANVNTGIEHLEKTNVDGINDGEIKFKKDHIKEIETAVEDIWKGAEEKAEKEKEPTTSAVKNFKFKPKEGTEERKIYAKDEHLDNEEFQDLDSEDKFHYMYDKLSSAKGFLSTKEANGVLEIPGGRAAFVSVDGLTIELASSDQEAKNKDNSPLLEYDNQKVIVKPMEVNGFKALGVFNEHGHHLRNGDGQPYFIRQSDKSHGRSKYRTEELYHPAHIERNFQGTKPDASFETWNRGELEGQTLTPEHNETLNHFTRNPELPLKYGTSYSEFVARVIKGYKKQLENAKDKTLIVSHKEVMKVIAQWEKQGKPEDLSTLDKEAILSAKPEQVLQFPSKNGSIYLTHAGQTTQSGTHIKERQVELSPEGEQSAVQLGQQLKTLGISDIITSPLKRAKDTAIIIKKTIDGEPTKESKPKKPDLDKPTNITKFDKSNGKEETTANRETESRTTENVGEKNIGVVKKTETKRTGVPRHRQQIKNPLYLKILDTDVTEPHGMAIQYFVGKGLVSTESVRNLFKNPNAEINARKLSYLGKDAPSVEAVSELIHDNLPEELRAKYDSHDIRNALEEVITGHNTVKAMAETFQSTYLSGEEMSAEEKALMQIYGNDEIESTKDEEFIDKAISEAEKLSDEDLKKITDSQKDYDKWEEGSDIFTEGEKPQFQKIKEKTKGPEFKKWFGKSKVVDENGNPLVVFHGSGTAITEFSHEFTGQGNDQLGSGFYFTTEESEAKGYETATIGKEKLGGNKKPTTHPVYLSVQKPLTEKTFNKATRLQIQKLLTSAPEFEDNLWNFGDWQSEGKTKVTNEAVKLYADSGYDSLLQLINTISNDFYRGKEKELLETVNKIFGYDGVEYSFEGKKHFVAWFPNQIKSIDNNGEFSKTNDNIYFQKPKSEEVKNIEAELSKAESELKTTKSAYEKKKIELGKRLSEDQEDLFGDRKSSQDLGMFEEERASSKAATQALLPFRARYDKAQEEVTKLKKKLKEAEERGDAQTSLFDQKRSQQFEQSKLDAVQKITEHLKKANPKLSISYDNALKAAGMAQGNKIKINPFYAGTDTPIHEVAHILIDSIGGLDNRIIRKAVEQLKDTKLWAETEKRYPEYKARPDMLAKEVLAEAIGREGAGIFDKVADRSKFKNLLDYIFDRIKTMFGFNKNIAKSLAKQVIGGDVAYKKNIVKNSKYNVKNTIFGGVNESKKSQTYKTQEGETIPFNSFREQEEFAFPGSDDLRKEKNKSENYTNRLEGNEICWAERILSEQKQFSFTGPDKIKSSSDVAYLFRHLESAASENSFAVLMKDDGSYNVLYLSTGTSVAVQADIKMIFAAAKEFGATKVSFVHNHPSGNLKPSDQDYHLLSKLKGLFIGSGIQVEPGVIINLDSGKFTEFEYGSHEEKTSAPKNGEDKQVTVLSFEKQKLYVPSPERTKITSSQAVAEFVSKQKRGAVPKIGIIVINSPGQITRYVMENETITDQELQDKIITSVAKSGERVILVTNNSFDINKLKLLATVLAKADIGILDAIEITSDPNIVTLSEGYKSLSDEGLLNESEEKYLQKPKEPNPISPAKKKLIDKAEKLIAENDLSKYPTDKLIEFYNEVVSSGYFGHTNQLKEVGKRIAYVLFRQRKTEIQKTFGKQFAEHEANKSDLKWKDIRVKAFSHMTEQFPELQSVGKYFDAKVGDMQEERYKKKTTLERLGKAVIKEANEKLGLKDKLTLFSNSAKYFNYLDNKGKLLTLDEAKEKNLSETQVNYLKFIRELITERQEIEENEDIYDKELQALKIGKTAGEAFQSEGIVSAMSSYLGMGRQIGDVRIEYMNPLTNKTEIDSFKNVEKNLIEYSKKSPAQKIIALMKMIKYNFKARKQFAKKVNADENINSLQTTTSGEYQINPKGELTNRFDKPYEGESYSKDFYRAAMEFIDETTHVKHMNKVLPIINAIENLNKEGYKEHLSKPNVVKWIDEWRKMHLFKEEKTTDPYLDSALKFLRFSTSALTFMFNYSAGVINLALGLYNNWRAETGAWRAIGHKRLYGNLKSHNVSKGLGLVNPYAVDILNKYDVVNKDFDSNPKLFAGKLFDMLAFGANRLGEFDIQGSMFLGQLSKKDYNSFEYNDKGELEVKKGIDEKALRERMVAHKNRVSDIQGKYSDKDKRSIMNSELGKTALQYKVWIFDYWKERFGEKYITRDNQVHQGSWRMFTKDAIKDLKADIRAKGGKVGVNKNTAKAIWENKSAMQNLKGAMFVAFLLTLKYSDDDDEEKRRKALSLDNALGNILFIFDPDQLAFTIKQPVSSVGTLVKFTNVLQDVLKMDNINTTKLNKDAKKLIPYRKGVQSFEEIFGED